MSTTIMKKITHYVVNCGKDACELAGFSLDRRGVLMPCSTEFDPPEVFEINSAYKRPQALQMSRRRAAIAIKRTLNIAEKIRGSLIEGAPDAKRLLSAKGSFEIKAYRG